MAEEKKNSESVTETKTAQVNSSGGIMFIGIRFLIFFGLSFFILSLPYNKRPVFYYLHQGTSKVILGLTGTNYYKPTFTISSPISNTNFNDTVDKAKTQLSAPVKKVLETNTREFIQQNNEAQFIDEEN